MLIWSVTNTGIGIEVMKIWIFDIIEMWNEETNTKETMAVNKDTTYAVAKWKPEKII